MIFHIVFPSLGTRQAVGVGTSLKTAPGAGRFVREAVCVQVFQRVEFLSRSLRFAMLVLK